MLDLLIRGGRVIDGAGNPWFRGDVGVVGDQIVAVGPLGDEDAHRTVDADGLFVCPGFIDMHTHSDIRLLVDPAHEAKLCQGVTTELLGQDGLSYAPVTDAALAELREQIAGWNDDPHDLDWSWRTVGEYLDRLDQGIAANAAYLVPQGTLRLDVMGADDRPPTAAELEEMKRLLREGMEQGAVGLSSGLTYTPGMYATDDEVVELCRELVPYGGFYCTHHRNYGLKAIEAYRDAIDIGRRSGAPVHLSHAHLGFPVNRGRAPELLAMIDEARAEGVEVTMDTYPYLAGATSLHALLPSWVLDGGVGKAVERLTSPDLRERIRVEMEETGADGFHFVPVDWSIVVVAGTHLPENAHLAGKTVASCAEEAGRRPIDLYCELLAEERLGTPAIVHIGNEENVRTVMTHPAHCVGSDGILVGDAPHPRGYGTFPRYLGHYVRELAILSWEEAVRKMTSAAAQRLGFGDRGLLRPGMAADIVCFDPETVRDVATYEDPRRTPEGMPYVVVNGQIAVAEGRRTEAVAGRALRRSRS